MNPSLLSTAVLCALLAGCGSGAYPEKPMLPVSVSPGWTQKSYSDSAPPEGLPAGETPRCWKALYTGAAQASAEVWVCGYKSSGSAFDAAQRARAAANTVKFYKGNDLVVVRWTGGTQTDLTNLLRVLEKDLGS